jgi:hypothetical protein
LQRSTNSAPSRTSRLLQTPQTALGMENFNRWEDESSLPTGLLVEVLVRLGRENILGFSGDAAHGERYPISYYNELFV